MKPVGVTTKKNIALITSGEIIFPNKIPTSNQSLLNGDKIEEFNNPKIKNIREISKDQSLMF